MEIRTEIDPEKLNAFVGQLGESVSQGMNCALSYVGDHLGLYRALSETGPGTSQALADHTGLHERWLREWLRHQAVLGQLEYVADNDCFYLSPEAAVAFLDEKSPAYFAGAFEAVIALMETVKGLPDCFRTGIGQTYDEKGAGCACGVERLSQQLQKYELVPTILPLLDDVVAKLEAGATVADVGCGGALSTVAMARAYPRSHFVAYDISLHALERARRNVAEAGLTNVEVSNPAESPMPSGPTFDLATTFDVVHDTPYPAQLIRDIRGALKPDGTWLCEDIRSFPTFPENLENNPIAGLLYGFSVNVCMSSAMSKPDGAGLGTLGFNEEVAKQMAGEQGFTRFRRLPYDDKPLNNYYEIRP
jgi:SAM-dependent methyltransferase